MKDQLERNANEDMDKRLDSDALVTSSLADVSSLVTLLIGFYFIFSLAGAFGYLLYVDRYLISFVLLQDILLTPSTNAMVCTILLIIGTIAISNDGKSPKIVEEINKIDNAIVNGILLGEDNNTVNDLRSKRKLLLVKFNRIGITWIIVLVVIVLFGFVLPFYGYILFFQSEYITGIIYMAFGVFPFILFGYIAIMMLRGGKAKYSYVAVSLVVLCCLQFGLGADRASRDWRSDQNWFSIIMESENINGQILWNESVWMLIRRDNGTVDILPVATIKKIARQIPSRTFK